MSAGFYKVDGEYLTYAPNFVYNDNYTLRKEDKDELRHLDVFPIDGWYWFDSLEQATEQLGAGMRPEPSRERKAPEKIELPRPLRP